MCQQFNVAVCWNVLLQCTADFCSALQHVTSKREQMWFECFVGGNDFEAATNKWLSVMHRNILTINHWNILESRSSFHTGNMLQRTTELQRTANTPQRTVTTRWWKWLGGGNNHKTRLTKCLGKHPVYVPHESWHIDECVTPHARMYRVKRVRPIKDSHLPSERGKET